VLHESVDPAVVESTDPAAAESTDLAATESIADPLHTAADPATGATPTETSS
jgi:hypothetical protein